MTLRQLGTLGTAEGPGALGGEPINVAQDSRGNYYVASLADRTRILVFDANFKFGRQLGRPGHGPGEFDRIQAFRLLSGDTLVIFDQATRRFTFLSSSGSILAMSSPQRGLYYDFLSMPDGSLITNGALATREHIGFPLQIVTRDGLIRRAFGADDPIFRADVPHMLLRSITPAGHNRIWSAHKTQYALEEWDLAGDHRRTLVRNVRWFEPYLKRRLPSRAQPIEPWLFALHRSALGLVFAVISVPVANWAEVWDRHGFQLGKGVDADQRTSNSILEVLDPDRGLVLVSQRFPQYFGRFINDSTLYSYRVDEVGTPYIDVWRITLHLSSPRRR